jgi:hypothetical protein
MKTSRLSKLTSRHGEWIEDKDEKAWVYHVTTAHLLIQAAGYLKHVHGQTGTVGVFYRGQERLYGCSLQPSLYRGVTLPGARNNRNAIINDYLAACKKQGKVLKNVPECAWEPLLQHYGIRTKWIDLVDNVWVALWFACHTAHSTGRQGEYLHFEQRRPSVNAYAYIVLVEVGLEQDKTSPGYFNGKDTELVDLRLAAPSTFLRPHAQHGLLAKAKLDAANPSVDYQNMIVGILRVELTDALRWLGDGVLLTPHVLFPPPVYDFGYRDLLNFAPVSPKVLGALQHIGA